jgi:hypothetical protein
MMITHLLAVSFHQDLINQLNTFIEWWRAWNCWILVIDDMGYIRRSVPDGDDMAFTQGIYTDERWCKKCCRWFMN